MRFIKKQLSLWRIVLIIGVAAIAIPITARVSPPTAREFVKERPDYPNQQTTADNDSKDAKDIKNGKAAVGKAVGRLQDYRERRREYWERRVERRLDAEENRDEQTGNDDDEDPRDSQNANDEDEEGDVVDKDVRTREDVYERRREYWRQRVERNW